MEKSHVHELNFVLHRNSLNLAYHLKAQHFGPFLIQNIPGKYLLFFLFLRTARFYYETTIFQVEKNEWSVHLSHITRNENQNF